jgi:hypothetical protein
LSQTAIRRGPLCLKVLPQDFASFSGAVDGTIPSGPGLSVAEILGAEGRELLAVNYIALAAM